MIRVEFDQEIIDKLDYERYHHPNPRVQKKMELLYLKSTGMAHRDLCRICRISKTTLSAYLKQYRDGGLDRLKQLGHKGQPSALHRAVQNGRVALSGWPGNTNHCAPGTGSGPAAGKV
jgi:hypothetical protein